MDNNKLFSATQLRLIKNKYSLKPKLRALSHNFTPIMATLPTYNLKTIDTGSLPSKTKITEKKLKIDEFTETESNLIRKNRVMNTDREANTREELDVLRCNNWNKNYKLEFDWEYLKKRYSIIDIADRKKLIQENLAKSSIIPEKLADFYKKIDQENSAVFIHNINLSKDNFKFEQFKEKIENRTDDINSKEMIRVGNKITFKDKVDFETEDDLIQKFYSLRMQGEYSKLTSIEYYRNVIREKEEVEKIYKRELMNIGRLILQKRKEKKLTKKKWDQALAEYASMKDNNTVK